MKENPLLQLESFGQSIGMDYIGRHAITSGELKRLITEDGVCGVTSNPSIFEKAIDQNHDYDEAIRALAIEGNSSEAIYKALTQEDIRMAADIFRQTYDRLEGGDGFVSLEVNPHLAYDAEGTIAEARRLWSKLQRPNVFIKVPATRDGFPAIQQLISEVINVNVTLLFGLPRYREVAEAYLAGLEERAAAGRPLGNVASVASFFLSRIDILVDPLLEKIISARGAGAERVAALRGQTALPASSWLTRSIRTFFRANGLRR